MPKKKELSVFIDESGEISAPCDSTSIADAFYIVGIVLHPQYIDISGLIDRLNIKLNNMGENWITDRHAVHSYNLIRGDKPYRRLSMKQRRKMFNYITEFTSSCSHIGLSSRRIVLDRREFLDEEEYSLESYRREQIDILKSRIRIQLLDLVTANRQQLERFDAIKIYYDNGQTWLAEIIHDVMDREITKEDLIYKEGVRPEKFKLFQVADLICTESLLEQKTRLGALTPSDIEFFGKQPHGQKKNALKMGRRGKRYKVYTPEENAITKIHAFTSKIIKLMDNQI